MKKYLKASYHTYLRDVRRMLLLVNEWAQRSDFNFLISELLEQGELFMINDKFIHRNYWDMANKQLNMLVKNGVLLKEKRRGQANRYYTRPVHELEDEYEKKKTSKHTHQVPHIFKMMYWESRKHIGSDSDIPPH